jgi:hypothetical protein
MIRIPEADRPPEDSDPVRLPIVSASKDFWTSLSGVQGLRP